MIDFFRYILFGFLVLLFLTVDLSRICYAKKPSNTHFLNYEIGVELRKKGDFESAILYLNNALKLNASDLPSLIELSEIYMKLGDNDLAIVNLKKASNLAPHDAYLQLLLGIAYDKNKRFNDAVVQYKKVINLEPENALIRVNLGLACLKINDNKCAIDNLGRVILVYPNELKARAGLGIAYHREKDYGIAKEQYKYVLKYEPNNVSIWYNLARLHLVLGEYEKAKTCIEKAILIDDSYVDLYLDRAQINYKLNKLEEVESDYLLALKHDPLNPVIPIEYAYFLWKTGAYLKAAEQFTKAIELDPSNQDLLVNKAYLLQLAGEIKQATSIWQEVIKNDNENQIASFNLAKLYQSEENYENAIDLYKKVLSLSKNNLDDDFKARASLAYCFHKAKKYDEAKSVYEDLVKENQNEPINLYNFAVLLIEEKSYNRASEYLKKAISNNFLPISKAYRALIETYTELKDNSSLKKAYMDWLSIKKDNIEVRLEFAKFLSKIGDTQGAGDQYRIVTALDTSNKSRYNLAQFLFDQNDLYGAVGQLQEYLKTEQGDLNALVLLANAFKDLGITEQAINTYKKIISLQSDNHLAHYNLGLLYEQGGKFEEAKNFLLKAIELNDAYAPAYYALGLSYLSTNNDGNAKAKDKAKELFEKYLILDPNGEYKEKVETKLKELVGQGELNQPRV